MGNHVIIYEKDRATTSLMISKETIAKELNYRNLERQEEEKKNEKRREEELKERRERSFKRGLKQLTISDGMKSSVHCLPTFSDPKAFRLVKLVWMLITMSSWSYWMYQTYGLYQSYATYGVISSYSTAYDTKTIFPGSFFFFFLLTYCCDNFLILLLVSRVNMQSKSVRWRSIQRLYG